MLTFIRVVVSFAIVGVVLYAFVRASSGRLGSLLGGTSAGRPATLEVVERRQLTRNSTVALLRAGDRHLLIGVGEAGVSLLAEGDYLALAVEEAEDSEAGQSRRRGILRQPSRDQIDIDLNEQALDSNDPEIAWTRLEEADAPRPAGMNLLAALRELTVRRS